MKKTVKSIFLIILFFAVFPALAGVTVMTLWNALMPALCGFSVITFPQSIGLFILGQILSAGVIVGMLFLWGGLHALSHHRGDWHGRWHKMTDEQRREFIHRRREHFASRKSQDINGYGAE